MVAGTAAATAAVLIARSVAAAVTAGLLVAAVSLALLTILVIAEAVICLAAKKKEPIFKWVKA